MSVRVSLAEAMLDLLSQLYTECVCARDEHQPCESCEQPRSLIDRGLATLPWGRVECFMMGGFSGFGIILIAGASEVEVVVTVRNLG